MASDGPDPPACEVEIYMRGTIALVVAGVPSNAMERWVARLRTESGQRVDWHFAAGRAFVKVIGDVSAVRVAAAKLFGELPTGASCSPSLD